jgi:hypothetical protein
LWRPSYECELAVVSNADFGPGSNSDIVPGSKIPSPHINERSIHGEATGSLDDLQLHLHQKLQVHPPMQMGPPNEQGDMLEIWDVRRPYLPKWIVKGSAVEGGVTGMAPRLLCSSVKTSRPDIAFGDSHSMWAQHSSGAFSQLDVRHSIKPLDAVPRVSISWDVSGTLAFVSDRPPVWETPYDDMLAAIF